MSDIPQQPFIGEALLERIKNFVQLPRTQLALLCGYYTVVTKDGQTSRQPNLQAFYDAVLIAKGVPLPGQLCIGEPQIGEYQPGEAWMLPESLEPFRAKLEATVKPYIKIQTHLTRQTTLFQSKFAGFPYLPKDFEYPKTPQGEYLYLLAQINFAEVPHLEGFPDKGILQFYLAKTDSYGRDFYNSTNQAGFRVVYFANPDLNEDNLTTNFDFLPSLWDSDVDVIPFYAFAAYTPHRDECFALSFKFKYAPISDRDYQFEALIDSEMLDVLAQDNDTLWDEYSNRFVVGHKLGGYPNFTQDDPRMFLEEEEPYILLLQIDSESNGLEKIDIMWGDGGVANFWIKQSALKRLDFSEVLYNWDCC